MTTASIRNLMARVSAIEKVLGIKPAKRKTKAQPVLPGIYETELKSVKPNRRGGHTLKFGRTKGSNAKLCDFDIGPKTEMEHHT